MVLKADSVRSRLRNLEEVVSRLQQVGPLGAQQLATSFRDAWLVERGLQLGAEIILDVGNHILSAHFGLSADKHEEVVALLAREGVIDEDLRVRLTGIGGFRNILVHDYLRIDPALVADNLARAPRDFSDFGAAIDRWLEKIGE